MTTHRDSTDRSRASREQLRGELITPGAPGLRRGAARLERHVRPPARGDRARAGRGRRRRRRGLRARERASSSPSAAAATRRPGYSTVDGGIVLDLSRMRGVLGRPVGEGGPRAGGRALGRRRPRDAGARARRARAARSRTRASPGSRSAAASAGSRGKHGLTIDNLLSVELVTADGRLVTRVGDRAPRALLGPARRLGQLRRRRLVRVPAARRSARSCSAGRSSTRSTTRRPRCGTRATSSADAPDDVSLWLVLTHVPPAPPFPDGAPGHAGARRRAVLHRPRARPGAARAAHVVRLAAREPARADPVHRAAVRARRRRPARPSLLGARRLPRRPLRRGDRRARRGRADASRRRGARSSSSRWAAPSHASRPTRPRSGTGRRRGRCGSRASGPTRPRTTPPRLDARRSRRRSSRGRRARSTSTRSAAT